MFISFERYLETVAPVIFSSFWGDGRIVVHINGKRYVYLTDALYHDSLKRLAERAPGKALNELKKMVGHGSAEQIEPEPKKAEPAKEIQVQRKLF